MHVQSTWSICMPDSLSYVRDNYFMTLAVGGTLNPKSTNQITMEGFMLAAITAFIINLTKEIVNGPCNIGQGHRVNV